MSLRDQVLLDVQGILESESDYGQPIDLIDPAGVVTSMIGLTGDISRKIEPESGALVKGRTIHVTLFINSLPAGERPTVKNRHVDNLWRVSFPRVTTAVSTGYAVIGTDPDDSLGTIVLELGNVE